MEKKEDPVTVGSVEEADNVNSSYTYSVLLYTSKPCPWCDLTRDFLKRENIAFKEIDVSKDVIGRQQMIMKSGQGRIPVVDIDGKIIIGYDPHAIIKALHRGQSRIKRFFSFFVKKQVSDPLASAKEFKKVLSEQEKPKDEKAKEFIKPSHYKKVSSKLLTEVKKEDEIKKEPETIETKTPIRNFPRVIFRKKLPDQTKPSLDQKPLLVQKPLDQKPSSVKEPLDKKPSPTQVQEKFDQPSLDKNISDLTKSSSDRAKISPETLPKEKKLKIVVEKLIKKKVSFPLIVIFIIIFLALLIISFNLLIKLFNWFMPSIKAFINSYLKGIIFYFALGIIIIIIIFIALSLSKTLKAERLKKQGVEIKKDEKKPSFPTLPELLKKISELLKKKPKEIVSSSSIPTHKKSFMDYFKKKKPEEIKPGDIIIEVSQNETEIDTLYHMIQENGKITILEVMHKFGVPKELAEEWAQVLESHDLITINYPLFNPPLLILAVRSIDDFSKEKAEKPKETSVSVNEPTNLLDKEKASEADSGTKLDKAVSDSSDNLHSKEEIANSIKKPEENKPSGSISVGGYEHPSVFTRAQIKNKPIPIFSRTPSVEKPIEPTSSVTIQKPIGENNTTILERPIESNNSAVENLMGPNITRPNNISTKAERQVIHHKKIKTKPKKQVSNNNHSTKLKKISNVHTQAEASAASDKNKSKKNSLLPKKENSTSKAIRISNNKDGRKMKNDG